MSDLKTKLKNLPTEPGVYFYKNADKKIIYIGKAAVLKNRVSSYFQNSVKDPKTTLLVREIADLEWITVGSEVEALFLESEFIKRYKPKYNVDWKDEKNFTYLRITTPEAFPVVSYVRRPMDDKATYFGPFTSSDAVRRAMKMLRRAFPYVTHTTLPARGCLQFHLGLCPGPEEGAITSAEYKRRNIKPLIMYLSGQRDKLMQQLEREMQSLAKKKDFEGAARARNQLRDLKALSKQMIFGDKESFDLSRDQALTGLAERLDLPGAPRRIECYDISHIQGSDNVASMIVFQDGVPHREEYRRFKMRLRGNDDFAHMREVVGRRFSNPAATGEGLAAHSSLSQRAHPSESKTGKAGWSKPDLVIIDGGKGQLNGALSIMSELGVSVPTIGLAKREEEIIRQVGTGYESLILPRDSHVLHLLQRIRDEAHRFAVTYHTLLRSKRQTRSLLDSVPGIGPATRKKLIKSFGSVQGVKAASEQELAKTVGPAKAAVLKSHLAGS